MPLRVNPTINYGLWVIMMCQCRLVNFNKCVTRVGEVNNGEAGRLCLFEDRGSKENL